MIGFLAIGAAVTLLGLVIVAIARLSKRRLPRAPLVEFLPPRAGSIFEHGLAVRADRRVLTAALIDLAVRGQIRVLTSGSRGRPVAIQVLPDASLTPEERTFLGAFRPSHLSPREEKRYLRALGEIGIVVPSLDEAPDVLFFRGRGAFRGYRRRRLTEFFDATRERMTADGFTRKGANSVHLVLLSLLFLASAVIGLVFILASAAAGEWLVLLAVAIDIALIFWVLTLAPPPLLRFTEQGEDLRRHLAGLRTYMGMAEQERLRVLQSPEGALRTPAGALTVGGKVLGLEAQPTAGDPVAQSQLDRYVLTERLLPYAILFRQERQWQTEFEHLGGPIDISRNMRTLGTTLETTVAVVQVLILVFQILRVVLGILSFLFRR